MDVPTEWATGAVRVSFSNDNTKEEVEQFIEVLHPVNETIFVFKIKGRKSLKTRILIRYGELSTKGRNKKCSLKN